MRRLWPHQQKALDIAEATDFASGTYAHATGTGKSVLGHAILRAFAARYPGTLLLWLCNKSASSRTFFRTQSLVKVCWCVTW